MQSFDSATGELTITLFGGGSITGIVNSLDGAEVPIDEDPIAVRVAEIVTAGGDAAAVIKVGATSDRRRDHGGRGAGADRGLDDGPKRDRADRGAVSATKAPADDGTRQATAREHPGDRPRRAQAPGRSRANGATERRRSRSTPLARRRLSLGVNWVGVNWVGVNWVGVNRVGVR